jgi:hypothetical protein
MHREVYTLRVVGLLCISEYCVDDVLLSIVRIVCMVHNPKKRGKIVYKELKS